MKLNHYIILAITVLFILSSNVFAAEKGRIMNYVKPGSEELKSKKLTVMITVLNGEHPVAQEEITVGDGQFADFHNLPLGNYRIRYEGPGLQTIEKQGILVFPEKTTNLKTYLKEGSGTATYVYSTSLIPINLTEQEIERRIKQLKRELGYLQSYKK